MAEEKLEPSELWRALTTLPRPTRAMPLPIFRPGTEESIGEVHVWPLTQEEQMAANAAADKFTKELLKDPQKKDEANLGYHSTYTNEVAIQVLFRACRDKDDTKRPAFPSPSLMRQKFSTDQIGVMFHSFCTIQSELGPIRAHLTKEETDALIIRLAEGGSAFPFDSCSWEQQRTLALSMASQLVSCWTAMFSAGLPLELSSYGLEKLTTLQSRDEAPSSLPEDPLPSASDSVEEA